MECHNLIPQLSKNRLPIPKLQRRKSVFSFIRSEGDTTKKDVKEFFEYVFNNDEAMMNLEVLKFIGMVSTAREENRKICE